MIKVGLVSLGCAKNLIDSEIMIGHLQQAGMVMTPEPDLADVLIVNTCSFIDMAKKESIGAVHDAVDGRSTSKKRTKQKIIVAGCLSQRFSQELPSLMPDVDAFIGLDQITQVAPIIQNLLGTKEHEQENLVTKQPNPADARSWLVTLTSEGTRTVADLNQTLDAHAEQLLASLTARERDAVESSLLLLLKALREDTAANCCLPPPERKESRSCC